MIRVAAVLVPLLLAAQDPKPAWQARLEKHAVSAEAWRARRQEIRQQILVAAGLWPEFERPALKPVLFGKVEGDGYTIERVHIETWPGFHLTGSLYRPAGKKGPFPGILSPHGHWREGRYTQEKDGNLPARGITFARLGFVCFMYDMVGYGDLKQLPHKFEDPGSGIGLLGLQLWNSLRAVDFMEALPDVDPKRIGCTGASGGGTQTFLLAAVDDRIACAAPVNMVAAEFQGGCSCENAPSLRIGLNNVEIAAATAPRPLLLVAATGDWTKHVPALEGPALQKVYTGLGVPDRFRAVQFDAPHNYNKDSREAVYAWFARWLQGAPDQPRIEEPPVPAVKREDLAIFTPDHPLPPGAVDAEGLKLALRKAVQSQLDALRPKEAAAAGRYRDLMLPALRRSLAVEIPGPGEVETVVDAVEGKQKRTFVRLRGTTTPVEILSPHPLPRNAKGRAAILAVPGDREDTPLVRQALLRKDLTFVVSLRPHRGEPADGGNLDQRSGYGTTFFRTPLAWQVQDLLTAIAWIEARPDVREVVLAGGTAALLAAATGGSNKLVQGIADLSDAEAAASQPGFARIDGVRTAAILVPPERLALHAVPKGFEVPGATLSAEAWTPERILEVLK